MAQHPGDGIQPDHTAIILDSIADGVFTVGRDWRITAFNRAAEDITGCPRSEAIGRPCCEVFRASICESDCALRHTMTTGRPVVGKAVYIVDADGQRVPISVSTALLRDAGDQVVGGVETFRDLSLVEQLQKELEGRHTFADILSTSAQMQRLFDVLPAMADSDSTVLIVGDSGTGKELFARAIHNLSQRRDGPMITVNCAALPDPLLESELFGHTAGAFTDARNDRQGRFALAQGGTIFLDEIGDISPALQVRLLRVLQEKTYEPLGSSDPVRANVRVVAATHRDLDELVRQGRFRQDLYYRVNVVKLTLPPLRDRKEDIPLLVDHFIQRFNRLKGGNITGVSPEVLSILMHHDFPGNVRELENAIEHAFVLCRGGTIRPECLPDHLRPHDAQAPAAMGGSLQDLEARFIRDALERHGWNRSKTARELGVHKTTLWRKIKQMGINLPDRDGRHKPQ